jgi:DNA polymerase I-like protein with 3'-5' exonuclease and polymerase domains
VASVRECFIPRPGWVYGDADYGGIEMCTLSQVCLDVLGYSSMAEALRRDEDLHLAFAADMLGISYTEALARMKAGDAEIKHYRQQAKPADFGYPGGMGAESFREYAEQYGIILTTQQAKDLKEAWLKKWTEMSDYFKWVGQLTEGGRPPPVVQIRSGRLRGDASYCAVANGFFQGLASDGAKEALWRVAKECYLKEDPFYIPTGPDDPYVLPGGIGRKVPTALYGCRPVLFIHDEIIMEIPYAPAVGGSPEKASAAVERLSVVMVSAMKKWVPDVPVKAGPVLMRRWYKGAEPVFVGEGDARILVPSKPIKRVAENGKKFTEWVADL